MAYDHIEPFGDWRDDWRIARLCLMQSTREDATLADFMWKVREQQPADLETRIHSTFARLSART